VVGERGGIENLAPLVRLIADRVVDPRRNRTRICLLLGAGADIGSGGISFRDLKRQAVEEFLKTPLFDVTYASGEGRLAVMLGYRSCW